MDHRQHQLKRQILTLRIIALVIVVPLGVFFAVFRTVYPHNHYQGPIAVVVVAAALGVVLPISRLIRRAKREIASLS